MGDIGGSIVYFFGRPCKFSLCFVAAMWFSMLVCPHFQIHSLCCEEFSLAVRRESKIQ